MTATSERSGGSDASTGTTRAAPRDHAGGAGGASDAVRRPARRGRATDPDATRDTTPEPRPPGPRTRRRSAGILEDLDSGKRRAATPDPAAPDGWRVDAGVREELLALFRDRTERSWLIGDLFGFRDRAGLPSKDLLAGVGWRIVPGGTSVRAGAYLGPGVTIMPPSYVNVGAWIGESTMVDSHVLVGSCAQIGARVHLSAGVQVGGVLEPPNARPVIVEDGAFVGAQCGLFEGVLVGRGAVLGAGVTLTGTSRLYDLVEERVLAGTTDQPLAVPPGSVVIPGARALPGRFAAANGLSAATALIVKMRDESTSARVALEEALR